MARSYKTIILLAIVLFCCHRFNVIQSESRDLYSRRIRSPSFSCLSTANATTSFHNHVTLLLSDFNVKSSLSSYYKTSIGRSRDAVYGYFMCRADVTHQVCNDCVYTGTQFVQGADCEHVDGILFSEMCVFRYSNDSIYGIWDPNLHSTFDYLEANVSNYEQFNRTLSSTLEALINRTAFDTSEDRFTPGFATMEAAVTENQTVFSLAQCTPDILGANCSQCLQAALSALRPATDGAPGAVSIMPQCQLRYDNISFYHLGDSEFSKGCYRLSDLFVLSTILLLNVYYWFN